MEKTLDKSSDEYCPRCTNKFECRPGDISSCNCSEIELSKEEYRFINSKFQKCLCNSCIEALKKEYNMNFQYNRLKNFKDRTFTVFMIFTLMGLKTFQAQTYAPHVGQAGTSAIYMDSSVFVSWAVNCNVTRGYQDISNTALGFTSVGDNSMATGKAQSNGPVSLGDGGSAICTFQKPIKNGPGNDFAVFENGFDDVFLELAFVEVSSDGVNFFRFHAHSLTDTVNQTNGFGSTDATKINNLAGKYRGGYGTPFDLHELAGKPGLDVQSITHVKIIDVVGSIDKNYATRDFYNNKINDPWPTPFPSGGFDLDAIGVIHESTITGIEKNELNSNVRMYPNPVRVGEELHIVSEKDLRLIEVRDLAGSVKISTQTNIINTSSLEKGMYLLKINTSGGIRTAKLLVL